MEKYTLELNYAISQDEQDPLRSFRDRFFIPKQEDGQEIHYFSGHSLGLQPKKAYEYVVDEMKHWQNLGVEGHHGAKLPWISYHEMICENMAQLVGADPSEVVLMNSLTVNLHLMLVSFYRPTKERFKILINPKMFSSDYYALCSEVKFHGFDPEETIIKLPASKEGIVDVDAIESILDEHGKAIALVYLEGVNFYTGQAFDLASITALAHRQGCLMGCDLAHGVGNYEYALNKHGIDFAVWCSYKYLNGGPGSIGGCFVHMNHHREKNLPRFAGWWGNDVKTRFATDSPFDPIQGAKGWQLSNPPILPLACLRASLEIFVEVGMNRLREKSKRLTGYLEFLLKSLETNDSTIITPKDPQARGCQLSLWNEFQADLLVKRLKEAGFACDLRQPHVIRIAPVPLYTTFMDVYQLYKFLKMERKY